MPALALSLENDDAEEEEKKKLVSGSSSRSRHQRKKRTEARSGDASTLFGSETGAGVVISEAVRRRAAQFAQQLYGSDHSDLADSAVTDVLMQVASERARSYRAERRVPALARTPRTQPAAATRQSILEQSRRYALLSNRAIAAAAAGAASQHSRKVESTAPSSLDLPLPGNGAAPAGGSTSSNAATPREPSPRPARKRNFGGYTRSQTYGALLEELLEHEPELETAINPSVVFAAPPSDASRPGSPASVVSVVSVPQFPAYEAAESAAASEAAVDDSPGKKSSRRERPKKQSKSFFELLMSPRAKRKVPVENSATIAEVDEGSEVEEVREGDALATVDDVSSSVETPEEDADPASAVGWRAFLESSGVSQKRARVLAEALRDEGVRRSQWDALGIAELGELGFTKKEQARLRKVTPADEPTSGSDIQRDEVEISLDLVSSEDDGGPAKIDEDKSDQDMQTPLGDAEAASILQALFRFAAARAQMTRMASLLSKLKQSAVAIEEFESELGVCNGHARALFGSASTNQGVRALFSLSKRHIQLHRGGVSVETAIEALCGSLVIPGNTSTARESVQSDTVELERALTETWANNGSVVRAFQRFFSCSRTLLDYVQEFDDDGASVVAAFCSIPGGFIEQLRRLLGEVAREALSAGCLALNAAALGAITLVDACRDPAIAYPAQKSSRRDLSNQKMADSAPEPQTLTRKRSDSHLTAISETGSISTMSDLASSVQTTPGLTRASSRRSQKSLGKIRNSRADMKSPFLPASTSRRRTRTRPSLRSLDDDDSPLSARGVTSFEPTGPVVRWATAAQVVRVLRLAMRERVRKKDVTSPHNDDDRTPAALQRAFTVAMRHEIEASSTARLETFEGWPLEVPTASELARNGFEYVPNTPAKLVPDRCRCVDCGAILSGWEPEDDPGDSHARLSPDCVRTTQHFAAMERSRKLSESGGSRPGTANSTYARTPMHLRRTESIITPSLKMVNAIAPQTWTKLALRLLEHFPRGHDILAAGSETMSVEITPPAAAAWDMLIDHLAYVESARSNVEDAHDWISVGTAARALCLSRQHHEATVEASLNDFMQLSSCLTHRIVDELNEYEDVLFNSRSFHTLLDILDASSTKKLFGRDSVRKLLCENIVSFALADEGLRLRGRGTRESGSAMHIKKLVRGKTARSINVGSLLSPAPTRSSSGPNPGVSLRRSSIMAIDDDEADEDGDSTPPLAAKIVTAATHRALTESSRVASNAPAWGLVSAFLARVVVQESPFATKVLSGTLAACAEVSKTLMTSATDLRKSFRNVSSAILSRKRSENKVNAAKLARQTILEVCSSSTSLPVSAAKMLALLHHVGAGDGDRLVALVFFVNCIAPALRRPELWNGVRVDKATTSALTSVSRALIRIMREMPFSNSSEWSRGELSDEETPKPSKDDARDALQSIRAFVEGVIARADNRTALPVASHRVLREERRGALLNVAEMACDPDLLTRLRERSCESADGADNNSNKMSLVRAIAPREAVPEVPFEDIEPALTALRRGIENL
jgi:Inhibitor of Apoptosis domain